MKILFVLHLPLPYPGAAWKRISHFANTFAELGNCISISGSFSIKSLRNFGVTRISGSKLMNLTPLIMMENLFSLVFNNISSAVMLSFIIAVIKPDVIIISVPYGQPALGSFLAAKLLRVKKIVFDYRDEWEDFLIQRSGSSSFRYLSKLFKRKMTNCYRKSSMVAVATTQYAVRLRERGIMNVKLIPNGADVQMFLRINKKSSEYRKKLGFDQEDVILVYSGMIGGYYRLDIVVKALANIERENVKMIMIGKGSQTTEILTLAKQRGIERRIFYAGEIEDNTLLAETIACCNIGLIPYDSNPLWKNSIPAKLFEYMASGLPIIATSFKDSELARLISDHNIGKVSDPENVEALSSNITEMIEDRTSMEEMAKNGIAAVQMNFDRTKIAKDFYSQITQ